MSTTPASTLPGYLNATAPERTPTISITETTITVGTASARFVQDVFIVDRGSAGDPISGFNFVALTATPLASYPMSVYRNGIRQSETLDYVFTTGVNVLAFPSKPFTSGETILAEYLSNS